mgnify:CR=1 FL=1
MDDLTRDKTALRKAMRVRRRQLKAESPQAAAEAAERLPLSRLPAFAVFSGYMPQGSEFDPWPVMERLEGLGAILTLPCANADGSGLVFREYDPRDGLAPDAFGIPAPPRSAREMSPDLVICPLLAFDRRGGRLGQGAGLYDVTLAALRARKKVFVLGIGYAGQEVEAAPTGPLDAPMDAILTETSYIPLG